MLDTDLVRWWAVAGTLTFLWLGAWAYGRHVWDRDPLLRWSGLVVGAAFVLVAGSIIVNAASPIPPTPGVKVFAFGITACCIAMGVVLARFRHP